MKALVMQARREVGIGQLRSIITKCNDVNFVLLPEGYLDCEKSILDAKQLARKYKVIIVSSYLDDKDRKDRGTIIDNNGKILFRRLKTPENGTLITPSLVEIDGLKIGYVLCREIFLDYKKLKQVDIIFNPIGVGMFSEEQYLTWSNRAKQMAKELSAKVLGVSHADGFYRDYDVSIPISFYYDSEGKEVLLSKNDTRSYVIDLEIQNIEYII